MMNPDEEKLAALLKRWRDIEPSATFEASVRRRLRLAAAKPERVSFREWLQQLAWQPAFAVAVAVVASVMIGSSAGVLIGRGSVASTGAELQFLGSGTLTGGYAKASVEGTQ